MWQEYAFSLEALNLAVTRRCFPREMCKLGSKSLGCEKHVFSSSG